MKILPLQHNEQQLIKKALKEDLRAQRLLYEKYAPKMLSVCRQYIKDYQFAEDAMVNGFIKVFKNLSAFEHKGSFEGWIRKIMVRESISFLRKKQFVVYDDTLITTNEDATVYQEFESEAAYIQHLIDELPEGYKMVFVLHVIEGYKHREIAEMLEISEGTSKSQFFKARRMLQESLKLKDVTLSSQKKRIRNE